MNSSYLGILFLYDIKVLKGWERWNDSDLTPDPWDFFFAEWTKTILNVIFQDDEVGPFNQFFATFWKDTLFLSIG
jgi:hypothetical protein